MDAPAKEFLQLLPRGLADRLDGFALVAQHDALVAVAGDIDHLVDPGRAVLALFPVLGFHRHLVGQFLVQAQGQLFAGHLGRDHAHGQVGDLVLGIEPGAFGHLARQPFLQVLHAVALFGRDHEGFLEGVAFVQLFGQGQQNRRLDPVDLVDRQNDAGMGHVGNAVQDTLHPVGDAAMRLDQQDDNIGIRRPAPGRRDHGPVQPPFRREEPRRVDKDDLGLTFQRDAADAGAGGLDLVGDDGHLGPHHPVGEGGFARIGLSDQGDESGAGGHGVLSVWNGRSLARQGGRGPVPHAVSSTRGQWSEISGSRMTSKAASLSGPFTAM